LKTNDNIKKLTTRLRILNTEIQEYYRGSFFGVRAMDPEVLHLWLEYNNLVSEFDTIYPTLFSKQKELPYPDPYLATEESFYQEGTMIYKPEHFAPIRRAAAEMMEIIMNASDRMIA
jgi:hypothetical protein